MSTAAVQTPPKPATEADLLALPDQGHGWELIDGEFIQKETGAHHGQSQVGVVEFLAPFRRHGSRGGVPGGWWILTEQLVRLPPHTVRPDVAGWRRERLPELPPLDEDAVLALQPDWICEIITPKKAAHDLVWKKRIYFQHEVPHYWIVDPRDETLTVHRWSQAGYVEVLVAQRGERVYAEPFDTAELAVGLFFGDENDQEKLRDDAQPSRSESLSTATMLSQLTPLDAEVLCRIDRSMGAEVSHRSSPCRGSGFCSGAQAHDRHGFHLPGDEIP